MRSTRSAPPAIQSTSSLTLLHARCTYVLLPRCRYGAHLSEEEVAKLVAPPPDTLELVHSWLAYHGLQSSSISTTHGGNWLTITGVLVSQANELLGASYQLYRHAGTNNTAILCTVGYALPTVLHAHVQTVAPTTFFSSTRTLQQTPHRNSVRVAGAPATAAPRAPVTVLSSRDEPEDVTPEYLRRLYKTFDYVPAATGKNSLGITGYNNEIPSRLDLTVFMTVLRNDAVDAIFTVEPVNGGTNDTFISWLAYVLKKENIPQTISFSYGEDEKNYPPEYLKSVCDLFAQLGARGVSVLFATGDHGVGKGDCKDGSGKVQFIPTFPSSCMCGVYLSLQAVRKRRHNSLTTSSRSRRSLYH